MNVEFFLLAGFKNSIMKWERPNIGLYQQFRFFYFATGGRPDFWCVFEATGISIVDGEVKIMRNPKSDILLLDLCDLLVRLSVLWVTHVGTECSSGRRPNFFDKYCENSISIKEFMQT